MHLLEFDIGAASPQPDFRLGGPLKVNGRVSGQQQRFMKG
jgi:hypothetical protein